MKKIKNRLFPAFIAFVISVGAFTSCNDDTQLKSLPYLFRPINFNVSLYKTVATISWAKVDSAKAYRLQISTDSLYKTLVTDTTITQLIFTKELAGETSFYARIKTIASDTTKNSKYNSTLTFKTPKENLFIGFGTKNNTGNLYSAYMNNAKTLDIKWQPAANTTHLILTSADGSVRDSVSLLSADITTGEKVVPALNNSTWKVQIYNGKILRGTTYGLVEGDIILTSGGDLSATLNNATAGQVIILTGGFNYTLGGSEYKFSKNVKIRGTSPSVNRSVVCLTNIGVTTPPTGSSNMMSLVTASALDSIVFENLDISGYVDNNPANVKIGYLYSNKVASTLSNLKFINCNIHNFGNTPTRVSGGTNQVITNLTYNGCVINDIGFTSTYAIVNTNSADLINNINLLNSTIYNFKGSLITRTGSSLSSITISNCNINQGMQDGSSARYLLDLNTATFNGSGGVSIKNCIFGQTGAPSTTVGANGFRGTVIPVITGSYYTTDYIDDPTPAGLTSTSLKSKMNAYSGKSTDLWNGPSTGDFSLKDTNFAGKTSSGDLRW